MQSAVTIAAAGTAEIPLVQRLAQETWHRHYPEILSAAQIEYMLARGYAPDALLRFVTERDAGLALALRDDEAVGFAAWYRADPAAMKLDKLYVLPQHQRAGVGRSLIGHVVERARAAGCAAVTLNVNRHNVSAIRAYERCGFALRGRGDFPIGDGFVMEDFIMVRDL
jgi:ribosomal protein S18 acetylase RimI-like enzyme